MKTGTVLIVDKKLGKVFTENKEEWCPIDFLEKCGAKFDVEVRSFAEVETKDLKQPIICVYRHPEDYQDKCVARVFDGTKPTNIIITRETVREIQDDIIACFPDMLPFARDKEDYKSVVESWI